MYRVKHDHHLKKMPSPHPKTTSCDNSVSGKFHRTKSLLEWCTLRLAVATLKNDDCNRCACPRRGRLRRSTRRPTETRNSKTVSSQGRFQRPRQPGSGRHARRRRQSRPSASSSLIAGERREREGRERQTRGSTPTGGDRARQAGARGAGGWRVAGLAGQGGGREFGRSRLHGRSGTNSPAHVPVHGGGFCTVHALGGRGGSVPRYREPRGQESISPTPEITGRSLEEKAAL